MHEIAYNEYPITWALQQITEDIRECVDNSGDGYGTESVRIPTGKVFDNYDMAAKYIEKVDHGDYDGIAVKFLDFSGVKGSKKIREYCARISDIIEKREEYIKGVP